MWLTVICKRAVFLMYSQWHFTSCSHHQIMIKYIARPQKVPLCPFSVNTPTLRSPLLQPLPMLVVSVLELHMNRMMEHVACCVWLLSFIVRLCDSSILCMYQYFTPLYCRVVFHCLTIHRFLSIVLLLDIWVVFTWGNNGKGCDEHSYVCLLPDIYTHFC